MQFVQISDLHIGGLFKADVFDRIVEEVNNLKPDAIIISGDLSEDGLIFQFQQIQNELRRFNCPNLIVFPGNHDYRHTGYLLFKKFFLFTKQIYEFDDNIVVVTLGTARPDRDEGEVGHRQSIWMEETLGKYNNFKTKIVAMHHHLIAIPDTGYTNVVGISDAGDTLRACLESKVDLVLCGHKHRPWLWNLGTLKIAYAGTACSWRYRGVFEDTYNIIDVRDGRMDIDIKIVGGKRMPLS